MSVKIMAQIWDVEGVSAPEKLVLLAIADHANDGGVCYPSMTRLARMSGMTVRGVQKVVRRLESAGYLRTDLSAGRGGANIYHITSGPEHGSPLNDVPPEHGSPPPPNAGAKTPEHGSPKPSRTINRIISNARGARSEILCILNRALSDEAAEGYFEHRKQMRKPLTKLAAELIVKKLEGHPDPDAVVNESVMNGWQGVFPEKVKLSPKVVHSQQRNGPKPVWQQVNERYEAKMN